MPCNKGTGQKQLVKSQSAELQLLAQWPLWAHMELLGTMKA